MKKLLLLSTLFIFACTIDDDTTDDNLQSKQNYTATELEKKQDRDGDNKTKKYRSSSKCFGFEYDEDYK